MMDFPSLFLGAALGLGGALMVVHFFYIPRASTMLDEALEARRSASEDLIEATEKWQAVNKMFETRNESHADLGMKIAKTAAEELLQMGFKPGVFKFEVDAANSHVVLVDGDKKK